MMEKRQRPRVDLSASCACGSASVAVNGPIRSMFMCSCEDCQKATGTGHATVAIADAADVTVTGRTKSFARPAASGATFTQHFCPECGTPLFGKSSRAPDALMLPVGLFGADARWFVPNQLIFARSHRDWDRIAEDLPQHQTYRERERIDDV
jgi:hypothetical protein